MMEVIVRIDNQERGVEYTPGVTAEESLSTVTDEDDVTVD